MKGKRPMSASIPTVKRVPGIGIELSSSQASEARRWRVSRTPASSTDRTLPFSSTLMMREPIRPHYASFAPVNRCLSPISAAAGFLVFARAHLRRGEDAVLADPVEGVLERFPGIGLEHDALARAQRRVSI